ITCQLIKEKKNPGTLLQSTCCNAKRRLLHREIDLINLHGERGFTGTRKTSKNKCGFHGIACIIKKEKKRKKQLLSKHNIVEKNYF
ncbi:hypothetical protein ACJX0J_007782, partial [Zea mays]